MISDPKLVLYACIAKETTILAEYNTSGDPNLVTLALQCLHKTPQFHSTFSHTIRNQTYTFLIEKPGPFVYFLICDENLDQSEGFWFLNRLKLALDDNMQRSLIASLETASSYYLQGDFNSIFSELLIPRVEHLDSVSSMNSAMNGCRDLSLDSSKGRDVESIPSNGWLRLKNKRRLFGKNNSNVDDKDHVIENKVDVIETREISIPLHKNGLYCGELGRHKVNQIWRRHVWMVLLIDLIVCSFLFGGWLWICKGFKCIAE